LKLVGLGLGEGKPNSIVDIGNPHYVVSSVIGPYRVLTDLDHQYLLLGEIFYAGTLLFAKASICLLLLRFMVQRIQKAVIFITLFVMVAISAIGFFAIIFQCKPVNALWTSVPGGVCHTAIFTTVAYAYSAVNVATDWILAIMPFFVLWRTNLQLKTRIGTGIILSLGWW